jgi:hypothetical protein
MDSRGPAESSRRPVRWRQSSFRAWLLCPNLAEIWSRRLPFSGGAARWPLLRQ